MQLDPAELVQQFQADWPSEAEMSMLRLLARKLADENTDLRAQVSALANQPYASTLPRLNPITDDTEGRHG